MDEEEGDTGTKQQIQSFFFVDVQFAPRFLLGLYQLALLRGVLANTFLHMCCL